MKTVLYKNLSEENLRSFRERGSIRVGSLSAYRTIEGSRKDTKEGVKEVVFRPEEKLFFPHGIPRNLMPGNLEIRGGFVSIEAGASADLGIQIPNAYIFCASEKSIKDKFGNDYYKIVNRAMFMDMLLEELKKIDPQIYYAHLGKVLYGGFKDFQIAFKDDLAKIKEYNLTDATLSDYLLKPGAFSDELEYRFIFFTSKSDMDGFVDLTCDLDTIQACCRFP